VIAPIEGAPTASAPAETAPWAVECLVQDPLWPCRYRLTLPAGATVAHLLARLAGLLPPAANAALAAGGLVPCLEGRPVAPAAPLGPGARLELCLPLRTDPRQARRLRAEAARRG
jgi:hypothetical protein